jgi:energy-coupling factor transporter ATP-binding protein EcfA2
LAAATSGYHCFDSGWCDLSGEHQRIRRELEELIRCYVEGCGGEYWMAVIVAPYGSGKTTLLKHLEGYARKLGAAALRIELSELVDFVMERYGTVHESELPRVIEEFVRLRLGDADRYVLLVDEVEESYDLLRGIVTFETSPFRGVAEAIRTRSTRVYLVLALGPSSTLKEAVFGPVAWRSRIYTIPLLPKSVVERMVLERVPVDGDGGRVVASLLANSLWWASKGRIAWARMLVDTVIPRLWDALWKGPSEVEAVLVSEEALGREIVEGVPLFDRQAFRELRRLAELRDVAPLLASLVGPIPLSLLSRLAGREVLPEPSSAIVYGRSLVKVEDLIGEAQAWLERYARAKSYPLHSVEHALTALEHVVHAWSLNGMIIYDVQSWRELFSLAADVAREIYADDPYAAQLLEALNPDLLSPSVERSSDLYAALRPSFVGRLYPTASSTPLLGCARRAGLSQVAEVVESLSLDELFEYSDRVSEEVGLEKLASRHGVRIVFIPSSTAEKAAAELACRILSGERLLVVLLDPRREARSPRSLLAASWAAGIPLLEAGQRLSMFVYSLLYSFSIGTEGCSLDNISGIDRRAMRLYSDLLRSLIIEGLASNPAGKLLAEAAKIEEEAGEAAVAAAKLTASIAEISAVKSTLEDIYSLLSRSANALSKLTGRKHGEEGSPLEVLEAVKRLASEVPAELKGALSNLQCSSNVKLGVPRILAALLGVGDTSAVEDVREALESVERMMSLLKSLPNAGPVAKAVEALSMAGKALRSLKELEATMPGVSGLYKRCIANIMDHVKELEAVVASLSKLYRGLEETVQQLPDDIRARVSEAIRSDMEALEGLESLASYVEYAREIVKEMADLASETAKVEEVRRRLVEAIEGLYSKLLEEKAGNRVGSAVSAT